MLQDNSKEPKVKLVSSYGEIDCSGLSAWRARLEVERRHISNPAWRGIKRTMYDRRSTKQSYGMIIKQDREKLHRISH